MTRDSLFTLERCLDSLAFCDALLVVDDFSSDGTWEFLEARARNDPRVTVTRNKLVNFADQRRFLHARVETEWMLVVDADEEAQPGLAEDVLRVTSAPVTTVAFRVPMENLLPPHWPRRLAVRNTQKRLLHTRSMSWPETDNVHAHASHQGATGTLRHGFVHHSFDSLAHLLKKQLAYGLNGGHTLARQGKRAGAVSIVLHASAAFLKSYFLQGLWRGGAGGFIAACAFAGQAFVKYSAAWEQAHLTQPIRERARVPVER